MFATCRQMIEVDVVRGKKRREAVAIKLHVLCGGGILAICWIEDRPPICSKNLDNPKYGPVFGSTWQL